MYWPYLLLLLGVAAALPIDSQGRYLPLQANTTRVRVTPVEASERYTFTAEYYANDTRVSYQIAKPRSGIWLPVVAGIGNRIRLYSHGPDFNVTVEEIVAGSQTLSLAAVVCLFLVAAALYAFLMLIRRPGEEPARPVVPQKKLF